MRIECWFDGSTEPVNPGGHTSYGALVKRDDRVILSESGYVGVGPEMSNNVGEYAGVIAVLKFLIREKISEAIIFGDSKLVIKQLSGKWKAKQGLYIPYYREAIQLCHQLPKIKLQWIPREQNGHADYLSRRPIKTAPQSESRREELNQLIREQKADMKDRRLKFYPALIKKVERIRVIRDGEVIASRPVKAHRSNWKENP